MRSNPQNTNINLYPFGISMVGYSNAEYYFSYGMNTQEKDDEIYGEGNSYSAEYWQYDSRLGRRWNNDPRPNPGISVYACFGNNPLWFSDVAGDSAIVDSDGGIDIIAPDGSSHYVSAHLIKSPDGQVLINPISNSVLEWDKESSSYIEIGLKEIEVKGQKIKSWKLPWWLESDAFTGNSDPVLSAPDASGGVVQIEGTASGLTGGFFIGMSRTDGFNLGFFGGGEVSLTRWGAGFTTQAASGNFTWKNYEKFGTNTNIGYGPVAYSYSEGSIYRTGDKSEFAMHGLSFGVGTRWFKSTPKINASTRVTYTLPLLE